jgi:hypothetical protein
MREIKFRAWNRKMGRMSEPFDLTDLRDGLLIPENTFLRDLDIMQYTGLRDINNVPMYEGDIVRVLGQEAPKVVEFDCGQFCIEVQVVRSVKSPLYCDSATGEVIGNIHANPDLLK